MRFDLKRPCPNCPFRTDGAGYLRAGRTEEIALSLARGAGFPCHKTTVDVEGENGTDRAETAESQFCAGALIMLEREGAPNQEMRIAERLGLYDPSELDMAAPVGTIADFQRRHADEDGAEPCHVADAGCLAPAGYLEGGVVVRCVVEEEIGRCEDCGEAVCDNCGEVVSERFFCPSCAEYEREDAAAREATA